MFAIPLGPSGFISIPLSCCSALMWFTLKKKLLDHSWLKARNTDESERHYYRKGPILIGSNSTKFTQWAAEDWSESSANFVELDPMRMGPLR